MRSKAAASGKQSVSQPASQHTGLGVYVIFYPKTASLPALTPSEHRPNMHLDTGTLWDVSTKGTARGTRHKRGGGGRREGGRGGIGGLAILVGREDAPPFLPPSLAPPPPPLPLSRLITLLTSIWNTQTRRQVSPQ